MGPEEQLPFVVSAYPWWKQEMAWVGDVMARTIECFCMRCELCRQDSHKNVCSGAREVS